MSSEHRETSETATTSAANNVPLYPRVTAAQLLAAERTRSHWLRPRVPPLPAEPQPDWSESAPNTGESAA